MSALTLGGLCLFDWSSRIESALTGSMSSAWAVTRATSKSVINRAVPAAMRRATPEIRTRGERSVTDWTEVDSSVQPLLGPPMTVESRPSSVCDCIPSVRG